MVHNELSNIENHSKNFHEMTLQLNGHQHIQIVLKLASQDLCLFTSTCIPSNHGTILLLHPLYDISMFRYSSLQLCTHTAQKEKQTRNSDFQWSFHLQRLPTLAFYAKQTRKKVGNS
ncbi:hypothetical protein HS088_TW15G00860 [Tripterygium wilfordii]|uniref:Uncharacterized protein n=1 Tax=Tripterygium wilfordii TaxID=458696 RepID=A0A7J7CMY6_TRIWF|nr:hypothetical protein HS088_TW15G00860 [Tripterygium wilfordii]